MRSHAVVYSFSGMRQVLLALTAISALSLGGCAKIDMPSTIHPEKIQLVTDNHSQNYVIADLTPVQFDDMASAYNRFGSGQAEVIVSYDPYSKKNTAMKAADQLQRISGELSQRGVRNIKSSIQAVEHSGDQSQMIIGYESVTAEPPKDCALMSSFNTHQAEADYDYKLGCSLNTMMARQVARPADLAGRAPVTDADGRRTGAVVEPYRAGTRNPALNGESASGN